MCTFQGTFVCLLPILPFCARHDVRWRPCISALRSIDIMTKVCYEGTYLGLAYRGRHVGNLGLSQIMASLGDPAIPKTGGVGRRPKDMLDTYDLIPILWHTSVQVGHVPHLPQP